MVNRIFDFAIWFEK